MPGDRVGRGDALILVRGRVVRDAAGRAVRCTGVDIDITARKAAEERQHLHAHLLESMSEGVSLSSEDGTIAYTNPALDRMLGYAPGELLGRHVSVQNAYPPEENARIVAEVIARLKAEGVWRGEWRNQRKDGSEIVTSARITAVEVGGRRHWLCVQEDVTERRRVERRLAAEHAVTQALAEAGDLAEAAPRRLERLCAALEVEAAELGPLPWQPGRAGGSLARRSTRRHPAWRPSGRRRWTRGSSRGPGCRGASGRAVGRPGSSGSGRTRTSRVARPPRPTGW